MSDEFDVVVIGGGPAGENAAGRCAEGGLSVTLVERELVGGECSYWGCMPSKALLRPGDVIAAAKRVPGAAEAVTGTIDVAAALEHRDRITSNWDDSGQLPWLEERSIELVRGAGRLAGERAVEVAAERLLVREEQFAGEELQAAFEAEGITVLTHMGKYQARIAADVILGKDAADRASADRIPRVTFTDPQVCAVGLTEAQAREQGIPVRVVTYPTGNVAGATVQGRGISGTSQLVVDENRRVIVGATFTGPGIQELLHSATVAIAGEVTLDRLWHAVPSFPTISEVWLRLLEAYGL